MKKIIPELPVTSISKTIRNCAASKPVGKWIYRHENALRRAFVAYSVSQYPFHRPPGLFGACDDFVTFMLSKSQQSCGVGRFHTGTIGKLVHQFCHTHPQVVKWNKPKKGKHNMVFVSRYGGPTPEYDFIDLSALANNVRRELVKSEE